MRYPDFVVRMRVAGGDGGGTAGGMAGGDDAGMLEQAGLGGAHAVDGAAEHGLDGGVGAGGVEGELDGDDAGDVGLVGGHPASDAGGELVEVLDDEGAAGVVSVGTDAVEGEDERVAVLTEVGAEPARGVDGANGCGR